MAIGIYRPFDLAQDDMFLETIDYRLHEVLDTFLFRYRYKELLELTIGCLKNKNQETGCHVECPDGIGTECHVECPDDNRDVSRRFLKTVDNLLIKKPRTTRGFLTPTKLIRQAWR